MSLATAAPGNEGGNVLITQNCRPFKITDFT